MNEIGIVYATKTKHSQRYAEAIGNVLNVRAENIAHKPTLKNVDLLFIVGGIYAGKSMPELLTYVQSLNKDQVKQAVLLTSNAAAKLKQVQVRSILEEKGIKVLDEIVCPGNFLFLRAGHPNASDVQTAVDFAKRVSTRI